MQGITVTVRQHMFDNSVKGWKMSVIEHILFKTLLSKRVQTCPNVISSHVFVDQNNFLFPCKVGFGRPASLDARC